MLLNLSMSRASLYDWLPVKTGFESFGRKRDDGRYYITKFNYELSGNDIVAVRKIYKK